jgi:predicted membrane-bound spermidine synthase
MLSVFLLFCVGVALFAIFGLKYSVDIELDPFYLENGNFNVGIVIGLIIFILAFIIGTLLAIIIPILFKESQAKYVRTDEWAKSAKKFKNEKYLKKLNLKSLIWAKKMLYIDKPTFVLYRHLLLKKK